MKAIIVLTFFGILGCTFCNHVRTGPEECRDVYNQADPNFDLGKFYTGSWYLTYAKYQNHTEECMKYDMTRNPLQVKYQVNGVKVTCEGTEIQGARHTEYVCKKDEGGSTDYPDYESVISVLHSDYTSYATVYFCIKGGDHKENVYVISRTKGGETPKAAKDSLQKLGENFDEFKKFTCS